VSPTTPGEVVPARSAIVSPAELLMGFINQNCSVEVVPEGAVVGGASDTQQQAGVVSLMDAGDTKREKDVPLLWKRVQVRCMGPTLATADDIGNHMDDLLDKQKWLVLEDSREYLWFVHGIYITMGTSHHIDSSETWESLLFANVTVGRDPVGVPGVGSGSGS